jgi:hypothetical protein
VVASFHKNVQRSANAEFGNRSIPCHMFWTRETCSRDFWIFRPVFHVLPSVMRLLVREYGSSCSRLLTVAASGCRYSLVIETDQCGPGSQSGDDERSSGFHRRSPSIMLGFNSHDRVTENLPITAPAAAINWRRLVFGSANIGFASSFMFDPRWLKRATCTSSAAAYFAVAGGRLSNQAASDWIDPSSRVSATQCTINSLLLLRAGLSLQKSGILVTFPRKHSADAEPRSRW